MGRAEDLFERLKQVVEPEIDKFIFHQERLSRGNEKLPPSVS